jgi:hypothetical protein
VRRALESEVLPAAYFRRGRNDRGVCGAHGISLSIAWMLIAEFHLCRVTNGYLISRMRWEAAISENGCQVCGPIMGTSTYHPLLNALLRATRLAYFPYVTSPVHFTAVTIARSVPTADLLLSQVKLGFYRERQS